MLEHLIRKYNTYVSNLEYHLETNLKGVPTVKASKERERIEERIRDFKEVVADLKQL